MSNSRAALNRRGILAMSAAMSLFVVNDALIKQASDGIPAFQAICLRALFAAVWIGLVLGATGQWRQMRGLASRPIAFRAGMDVLGTVGYLLALFHIPLTDATAINLSVPLMLTAMAVLLLREDVRWQRWAAVIAGFGGVLLVIQPSPGDMNAWAWLAFAATCVHAVRDLSTRWVPRGIPSTVVTFSTAAAVTLVTGVVVLVQGWQTVSARDLGLVLGASAFLAGGYYLLVVALRTGEISVVGSFRYSALVWAMLLGFVLWGEVPGALALVGIAVIVGSGLYLARR